MTPTDRLKSEHESILCLLSILSRMCVDLEARRNVDPLHLERVIEFMKIFIDKIHHGKEEDHLFPMMRKAGGHRESVQVSELMIDHIKGRSLARDMAFAATRYGKYDQDAPVRFIERARSYIELLTEHIHKENETYFPIVEKLLSERQKKELLDSLEALDKIMAHHHEHSSMLQALQSLERIFPG